MPTPTTVHVTPRILKRLERLKNKVVGENIKLPRCNKFIPAKYHIISAALDLLEKQMKVDSFEQFIKSHEGWWELKCLTLQIEKELKECNYQSPEIQGPESLHQYAHKLALERLREKV